MSARIIQVRPSRDHRWQKHGGWEVFEAEGVCSIYCDEHARDSALSYARQRAGYGRAEIQVLDDAWNVVGHRQRRGAAAGVAPRPTGITAWSCPSIISQYFIGGMMP